MTNEQILTVVLASAPTMLTVLIGILINNSRLNDMNVRISEVHARIAETHSRISEFRSHMDNRFDESKELWRSELHRVEEVLDARLKHLEEQR